MEKIENMAGRSLEDIARNNLSEAVKKDIRNDLITEAVALSLLAAGLLVSLFFPEKTVVPPLLYSIGFVFMTVPIYIEAFRGILTKNLTHAMEILVAIAVTACFLSGELITALLIPTILNIAHMLEERSVLGGREAIDGLRQMQQTKAVLIDGDNETEVDASVLKPGDIILVRPGTGIPADGSIISGYTNIDQKSLTGEPEPFAAGPGSRVFAGTVNIDGAIKVSVEKEYVDTSISNILNLLEQSENIKIPETQLIDRFLSYYIPFILAVAAGIALVTRDLSKAIAILVVSCPCGQMLVSSAPMIAALTAATKRGILIKNSKFIGEMTSVDTVVFDKTGTLTVGELSLAEIIPADGANPEEILKYAAMLAPGSNHPVSKAVAAAAVGLDYSPASDIHEHSGRGMTGTLPDGTLICFGRREWMKEAPSLTLVPESFAANATGSVSFVSAGGRLLGAICFSDTLRPDAAKAIRQLKSLGTEKTVMLTGDRAAAAEKIRAEAGIDTASAELLPEDKLAIMHSLRGEDRCVLAVGDGINDALALREADIGIAMGAMGSDLAIQSADIALMNNNLTNIPFTIKLAINTRKIIYQNLVISMLSSLLMVTLSATGVITSLVGALLHNIGAFAVMFNSSRLLRTALEDPKCEEKPDEETDAAPSADIENLTEPAQENDAQSIQ